MADSRTEQAGRKGGESVRHLVESGKQAERGTQGDPVTMLTSDHDKVKSLFNRYQEGDGDKRELADAACHELKVHTQLEEELYYPTVREHASGRLIELLDDALEEHGEAKDIITQLLAKPDLDDEFEQQFQKLQDVILHHVEEEEDEMFGLAREAIGSQSGELAQRMQARKKELESQIH